MRTIQTSLNESEYDVFRKQAQRYQMSDYEFLKEIVKLALNNQINADVLKFKKLVKDSLKEFIEIMDNAP
jgi:hypothetical protein